MGFLEQEWQKTCSEAKEFTAQARGDFGKLPEAALIFPPFRCTHHLGSTA